MRLHVGFIWIPCGRDDASNTFTSVVAEMEGFCARLSLDILPLWKFLYPNFMRLKLFAVGMNIILFEIDIAYNEGVKFLVVTCRLNMFYNSVDIFTYRMYKSFIIEYT